MLNWGCPVKHIFEDDMTNELILCIIGLIAMAFSFPMCGRVTRGTYYSIPDWKVRQAVRSNKPFNGYDDLVKTPQIDKFKSLNPELSEQLASDPAYQPPMKKIHG